MNTDETGAHTALEREHVTWKFIEIELSDKTQPDYLSMINRAEIDGVIIKNVLPKIDNSVVESAVSNVEDIMVEETDFGAMIGRSLDGCAHVDLEDVYFRETEAISKLLQKIFGQNFEGLFEKIVSSVSGQRSVEQPKYITGDKYKPATVRISKPGNEGMQSHIGNEFITALPQLEHIASVVDPSDRFSFFFLAQKAEEGGELVVFDLTWKNTPDHLVKNMAVIHKKNEREEYLNKLKSMNVPLEEGDLLIFDGGRIWHKVNPGSGNKNRVTIGGYAGISRDGKKFLYWS